MLDRLMSMEVFIKAVDTGSFAAAARQLAMSPQMVAKHVAALEERLGARLLRRTTRQQGLTEVGRVYAERCRLLLEQAEAAHALVDAAQATPRGRLRISAPTTFGAHTLVPLVTAYLREHPGVEIELALTDRFVDLVEEGFEVAFRIGALADSSLVSRSLAPYRLAACAAPDYLRRQGTPRHPADLADHDCLGYAYWPRPAESVWPFQRDGVTHKVEVRSRLQIDSGEALLAAALDGFGVVLCAEDVLREAMQAGRLVRVLADYAPPSRPVHLLYQRDHLRTPKLRSFIDAAVHVLGRSA